MCRYFIPMNGNDEITFQVALMRMTPAFEKKKQNCNCKISVNIFGMNMPHHWVVSGCFIIYLQKTHFK